MEKADEEEGHEEEEDDDDEGQKGEIDITDFEDLKSYKDIPGFKNFPTWLQHMIKEFKTIFTNQLSKHSIMNVKPATFTLIRNAIYPPTHTHTYTHLFLNFFYQLFSKYQ